MKRLLVAAVAASLAVLIALPAFAITNGQPDGDDHPYVGLAVFDEADGPAWRCSGTLVSPTIFLTAGHCTDGAVAARVWFHEDVDADAEDYPAGGGSAVEGTPHTHPQYNPNAFYLFDVGVVVLDDPVEMDKYGELPDEGAVDALFSGKGKKDKGITAVGYGLQRINPVFLQGDRIRLRADLNIVDIHGTAGIPAGTSMMVSGDAKKGGTCFGDSGGPQFQRGTNTVLAVTSFGLNGNCAGVGGGYRIDQPDDLEWLATFLGGD